MSTRAARAAKLIKKQERRAYNKIFLIGIASLVLLFFLLSFGVNVLVSLADFFENLRGGSTTANSNSIAPFSPRMEPLMEATNSAKITVSGFAQEGTTVEVFLNGQSAGKVAVSSEKNFKIEDLTLLEGENSIYAVATDNQNRSSKPSSIIAVAYKTKAPKLELSEPSDGASYSGDNKEVKVSGNSKEANSVTVNGFWAILNSDGTFFYNLSLTAGENKITVIATDKAGNQTKAEKKVNYNP